MVTVRGKVLSVNQPRAVGSPKKRLKLMEATLADKTGSIPLDLLESNIDQIKEGAVYSFNQVQVCVWSSRKKLSTTIKTTIQPFEEPDLANIEDSHCARDNETTTTMVNEIFSIQKIENFFKCANCSKKVIQANTNIIKCDQCHHIVRAANCTKGLNVKFVIKDGDNEITLTVNEEILSNLLEDNVVMMEHQVLGEKLLFLNNISITYNSVNSRVSEIKKQ